MISKLKSKITFIGLCRFCFFFYLMCVVLTYIGYSFLPSAGNVISNNSQCWWREGLGILSFQCGKDVLLGKLISWALNWAYIVAFPLMIVFVAISIPTLSVFQASLYFLAITYFLEKVLFRGRTLDEDTDKEVMTAAKYIFIFLVFLSLPFQVYTLYKIVF